MNSIIKKSILILAVIAILHSCIVVGSEPEKCDVKQIEVTKVYEGGVKDIVFEEDNGDFYYINRGLERGFTLEELRKRVQNKKVTLHLAKTLVGSSNHIAQLAIEDTIIFTEFTTEIALSEN